MEMKLEMVTLEQLGQRLPHRTFPRRNPEAAQSEQNSLQVPPNNRTATYVRNLPTDQHPETKLQADLELCRGYCKEQELEVVIEYSDPKGSWKEFRQMMTAALGRRPTFDNIVKPQEPVRTRSCVQHGLLPVPPQERRHRQITHARRVTPEGNPRTSRSIT